jgi:hypothetical protein
MQRDKHVVVWYPPVLWRRRDPKCRAELS